jgi:hypothetical protein
LGVGTLPDCRHKRRRRPSEGGALHDYQDLLANELCGDLGPFAQIDLPKHIAHRAVRLNGVTFFE